MVINQDFMKKLDSLKKELNSMQQTLNEKAESILIQMKKIYEEMDFVDLDDEYSQTNIVFDQVVSTYRNENKITVQTLLIRTCSCCHNESHYYSFPIDYLLQSDWQLDLRNKIAEEKKEMEQQKLQQEIEEAKQQVENERLLWEQLNQKFHQNPKSGDVK